MDLNAENVQCFLYALNDEINRRGGMFPQTEDDQRSDSNAIHRVCQLIKFYEKTGYPQEEKVEHWKNLRARNSKLVSEKT